MAVIPNRPLGSATRSIAQILANFDEVTSALDALAVASGTNDQPSGSGLKRRGKVSIAPEQSTPSASYVTMATPDTVTGIVLPTDGLIMLGYQAIWGNDAAESGRAAIFLGSNIVKIAGSGGGDPVAIEAHGPTNVNAHGALNSCGTGLTAVITGLLAGATEVSTGQVVAQLVGGSGGLCAIYATAGTYDVSIKFKVVSGGSVFVGSRHLWVYSMGF